MNAEDETWVTAVPELLQFIRQHPTFDHTLRLEQLLGLPPDYGMSYFVEMWVHPADLFRPTPDPEIDDTEAGIGFPAGVGPDHVAWFGDLKGTSYREGGYPWTRLGYTYDWGNPEDSVGPSEFIIRKAAPIEVASVTRTFDYLR